METPPVLQQPVMSTSAITARVVLDAKRAFSAVLDQERVEKVARQAVEEFWRDKARITTYIPVLAIRRVRDLLEQQFDNASATNGR